MTKHDSERLPEYTILQLPGIGLGRIHGTKLFEPFFTTKSNGLGMVLAISRRIVEAHEGCIWAEQAADTKGAAFRFTLRLCPGDAGPTRDCK